MYSKFLLTALIPKGHIYSTQKYTIVLTKHRHGNDLLRAEEHLLMHTTISVSKTETKIPKEGKCITVR